MRQISNQIFNTPTGRTYDPSEKIDRSFQRVGAQLEKMITDESDRKKREEDMFNQTYANIGEIEANLQQNYAGIMQQAVDSTKDYLKQQIKSGNRINDPEFQMGLQDRVSRIKTAVGNADRNREQLKQATELIKTDPAIMDKQTALTSLMTRFNDPDFLISKNPFNADEFLENFVNPIMVFEEARKSIPSDGTDEFMTDDDQGNTFKNSIIYNRLIPRDQPTLEDGSPNIQISDDFAQEVLAGKFGQRLLNITSKDAQSKYSDLPKDLAFKNALRDGFRTVMGSNFKRGIFETGDQKRRREGQERRQNAATDLAIGREQRLSNKETASDKKQAEAQNSFEERKEAFYKGHETGSDTNLQIYNNTSQDKMEWVKLVDDDKQKNIKDLNVLASKNAWESDAPEARDQRKRVIEALGLKPEKSLVGRWDTKPMYDEVMEKWENKDKITHLRYRKRGGLVKGQYEYDYEALPVGTEQEKATAFQAIEASRKANLPTNLIKEESTFTGVPKGGF